MQTQTMNIFLLPPKDIFPVKHCVNAEGHVICVQASVPAHALQLRLVATEQVKKTIRHFKLTLNIQCNGLCYETVRITTQH